MKRTPTIILVFLCLVYSQIHAQVFTNYSSSYDSKGFRAIAADTEGNIWFGSFSDGVLKFDGTNWTSYTTEDGLASNVILAITVDNLGNIWFGTSGGVSKYNGTTWTTYTTEDGLVSNSVRAVAIDKEGNIWFGTSRGVSKYNGTTWTTYNTEDGLVSNSVRAVAIDKEGNMWFGTGGIGPGGVSKFDGTTWTTYTIEDGLASNDINAISVDNMGNVWFGTEIRNSGSPGGAGVSKFDGTNWTSYFIEDAIGHGYPSVNAISIDQEGRIWIGTDAGAKKLDGVNWTSYTSEDGLAYRKVLAIAIDSKGDKWFASQGSISRYNDTIWTHYPFQDGPAGIAGTCAIAIDAEGNKWFGNTCGVSKFDGTNWTIIAMNGGIWVHTIAIDMDGNKWFSGLGKGIRKFDGTSWTAYTCEDGLGYVYANVHDAGGNMWFGTCGNGVSRFDGTNWTTYTTEDGLASNSIRAIAVDGEGDIWFGTDGGGVSRFNGADWTTYTKVDGLSGNWVKAILIDLDGNTWIGTEGGVSKFDGTNWTIYTTEDGLGDNNIFSIAMDSEWNIWFGTGGGVSRFDGTNWTTYRKDDGLLADFFIGAIALDINGDLWFGSGPPGTDGWGGVSHMKYRPEHTRPKVRITCNKEEIRCGDSLQITATFNKPILETEAVRLHLFSDGGVVFADMIRQSERTYKWTYLVPNSGGDINLTIKGRDLWGNWVMPIPISGETFTVIPITPGDVDDDGRILAYDAALTLQHSIGFDPLPVIDPIPWENWRETTANVDGIEEITSADADIILRYSVENLISFIDMDEKSVTLVDVTIDVAENEIRFLSNGDLLGLNILMNNENQILGPPQVIAENFLSVFNITDSTYSLGICTANSPVVGTEILKIPCSNKDTVTFNMVVNTELTRVTVDLNTAINTLDMPAVSIYPNPVNDLLKINGLDNPAILRIYSTDGQLMQTESLNSEHTEIDVSGLPKGMYILNLETDDGLIVRKISVI
jgi:ligand-binding sensor domain-containing protein